MKKMKMLIALLLACILLSGCSLFAEKPGCKLEVVARYSGTDIAGQDLPSGENTENFELRKGDFLGEDVGGELNVNDKKLKESKLIVVQDVTDEAVTALIGGEKQVCPYGEPISVRSMWVVSDGLNYSYTITFRK